MLDKTMPDKTMPDKTMRLGCLFLLKDQIVNHLVKYHCGLGGVLKPSTGGGVWRMRGGK